MPKTLNKARDRFVADYTKAFAKGRQAGLDPFELAHGTALLVADAIGILAGDADTFDVMLGKTVQDMQQRALARFEATEPCNCESCAAARQLISTPAAGRA